MQEGAIYKIKLYKEKNNMKNDVTIILDLLAMHEHESLLVPVRKNLNLLIKRLIEHQYKVEKMIVNKDGSFHMDKYTYYFNGLIDTIAYIAKFNK